MAPEDALQRCRDLCRGAIMRLVAADTGTRRLSNEDWAALGKNVVGVMQDVHKAIGDLAEELTKAKSDGQPPILKLNGGKKV